MFDGGRLRAFSWKEWENEDGKKKCLATAAWLWSMGMAIYKQQWRSFWGLYRKCFLEAVMVNCRNGMPVFMNHREMHKWFWSSWFCLRAVVRSPLLLKLFSAVSFYESTTQIFQRILRWANWKRGQPGFRLLLVGQVVKLFPPQQYVSQFIFRDGSAAWKRKIRNLYSEFLLQLIVGALWHGMNVWNLTTSNVALCWALSVTASRWLSFLCVFWWT